MLRRLDGVIPGAQHAPPRGWLDQDAPIFHVAQRVPLGGVGRVGVFKFPVIVDAQMDEAAMEVLGKNSANLLDRSEHLAREIEAADSYS